MRAGFEGHLRELSEIAKAEADQEELTPEEVGAVEAALDWRLARRAGERRSSEEDQARIYEIQAEKQAIMARLKADIAGLDDPEYQPERQGSSRSVMQENGHYYWHDKVGQKAPVTLGELMTDGEWGIKYNLDRASVPRAVRKRYLVERAKSQLRALLDEQIIVDEISSGQTTDRMRETYGRVADDKEHGRLPGGLIAERMVTNFLRKLAIEGADFEIVETDVFQDVTQKMDFIIRRKSRSRGVGVEEDEEAKSIAVQFTTATSEDILAHKKEQVERARQNLRAEDHVQDIVLVHIPGYLATQLYRDWMRKGSPVGGPDKLWGENTRKLLFTKVMAGIFTEDDKPEEQRGKVV